MWFLKSKRHVYQHAYTLLFPLKIYILQIEHVHETVATRDCKTVLFDLECNII